MQRIILIIALTVFSLGVFAQTKTEIKTDVKLENTDGKYHIKIKKEVDGKITTIDKTYNSLEEMKNDPELEGINLHFFDGDKEMVFINEDGEEELHKVKVIVEVDGEADGEFSKESSNSFMFKSDGDDDVELHEIKVWVDEDGEKHITKNGEEIEVGDGNSWTDKEGKTYEIKKSDGNIMIFSGDEVTEFKSADGESFDFKFSTDDGEHNVIMFKSSDGDGSNLETISIKVVEHIKLHLKEVEENEKKYNPSREEIEHAISITPMKLQ